MPPINQETLQRLKDNAAETAKKFGIAYSLNAAWTIYERARHAAEAKEPENLKLTYREFDSVVRTDLLAGYVDVRVGEGPGAMRRWKKVYCVERSDYGIEFYANQDAFERHKKPKTTIRPAGYRVITRDVAKPFTDLIVPIAKGLGIELKSFDKMISFPGDCWALFHPQRTKYIFRTCRSTKKKVKKKKKKKTKKTKKTKEEEEKKEEEKKEEEKKEEEKKEDEPPVDNEEELVVGEEEKIDRNEWIYFLQTCVRRFKARNTDTVLGLAFEKACEEIPEKVESLKGWKDHGTEDEMLLEMLMTSCLPPIQDIVLEQIKGYLSIPLTISNSFAAMIAARVLIPMWYTTVGLMKKAILSVLGPTWAKIQQGAQALLDKIEPVLRKGLTPIIKVHNLILEKIKKVTNKKMDQLLSNNVTPLIEPLIEAYTKPLNEGFMHVREIYSTEVKTEDLPSDATERQIFLDAIPRKRNTMKTTFAFALQLSEGLGPAKRLIDGTARKSEEDDDDEEDEDARELCAETEDCFLKGLDATVYTFHLRVESGEIMNDALKEKIVNEDFDRDVIQLKRDIAKKGIRRFVLKYFNMAKDADGELGQAISSVDDAIPSEMQDFLGVRSICNAFIEASVAEKIDRTVDAAETFQ